MYNETRHDFGPMKCDESVDGEFTCDEGVAAFKTAVLFLTCSARYAMCGN